MKRSPEMTANPLLASALALAQKGFFVFPLSESSKVPLAGSRGCHDATNNQYLIRDHWKHNPSANIGIATGASNLVVIDIDPGHEGDESFFELTRQCGKLEGPTVLTPTGGRHIYFTAPQDGSIRSRCNAFGDEFPGIDIRATGGYVVAPPSIHPKGGQYIWEVDDDALPLPKLPERWLARLANTELDRKPIEGADNASPILEGTRNSTLTRLAGRLRREGMRSEEIADVLLAVNERRCRPPLSLQEVKLVAESIGRYSPAEDAVLAAKSITKTDASEFGENGSVEATTEGDPPDLAAILESIIVFVRRFVVLSEQQSQALALWIIHTHAIGAADATPYVSVTSATKRSGKTRVLEVLELLVARSWFTGKVSPAALYRKIDKDQATLLLDESDAAFNGEREYAEALRGILNTGHRRGGKTTVCEGKGVIKVRDFSTFGAKAIAGIGDLPDTVADRAIPIRLERKAPGQNVERFRYRDISLEASALRSDVAARAANVLETLRRARPVLPMELNDRAADAWEPLFAIADIAGADWSGRAREAAIALSGNAVEEDASEAVRLLADVRTIFEEFDAEDITSQHLVDALGAIEESPWGPDRRGAPFSVRKLAALLRPFKIKPKVFRVGEATPRGYRRESFEDAWARYLPPKASATTQQSKNDEVFDCNIFRNVAGAHPQHVEELVVDGSGNEYATENGTATKEPCKTKGVADVADVAPAEHTQWTTNSQHDGPHYHIDNKSKEYHYESLQ